MSRHRCGSRPINCQLRAPGLRPRDQLAKAAEGPGFVDIPGVVIDGRTLTVRVLAEPQYEVATADSDGNVLP